MRDDSATTSLIESVTKDYKKLGTFQSRMVNKEREVTTPTGVPQFCYHVNSPGMKMQCQRKWSKKIKLTENKFWAS